MKKIFIPLFVLYLTCDPFPPGANQPTHFSFTNLADQSVILEPAHICGPSTPPKLKVGCPDGYVRPLHDISVYGSGNWAIEGRTVISIPGNVGQPGRYEESAPVTFAYVVGSQNGGDGWRLLAE